MTDNFMAAGLTGVSIFVRPEERPVFDALLADLQSTLNPRTAHERHVFDQILASAWNLRRCIELEAVVQNEANSLGFADAFFDVELAKKLDRVVRYKRQYETTYRRAMTELKQLTAARQDAAPPVAPEPEPEPAPAVAFTTPADDDIVVPLQPHRPESPRGA